MRLHAKAGTTPKSPRLLIDRIEGGRWSVEEAADAAGVCRASAEGAVTIASWVSGTSILITCSPPGLGGERSPSEGYAAVELWDG